MTTRTATREASRSMTMTTTTPITTNRGGWHTATVDATSQATHTTRRWAVTWRTQRITCCPSQGVLTVADGRRVPVIVWGSHGELRGTVTQCGGCGRVREANFTARRALTVAGVVTEADR